MNIHPLFVHFPIGMLVVYGLMELVPARWSKYFAWWSGAKQFLLAAGLVAAVPTLITGDMASDMIKGLVPQQLIERHEMMAGITLAVYLILGAAYLVRLFARTGWGDRMSSWLWNGKLAFMWRLKQRVAGWILETPARPVLALLGLVSITITGGLGAAIVYGPNIDPVVTYIYHLFF